VRHAAFDQAAGVESRSTAPILITEPAYQHASGSWIFRPASTRSPWGGCSDGRPRLRRGSGTLVVASGRDAGALGAAEDRRRLGREHLGDPAFTASGLDAIDVPRG
jgi:hypothetical protein